MAFPTNNGILDDLTGHGTSTLSSPWERMAPSATWGDLEGDGASHVRSSVAFTAGMAYADRADYGDQEAWVQLQTLPAGGDTMGPCVRVRQRSGASSTVDLYHVRYAAGFIVISKHINVAGSDLNSWATSVSAGDYLGASIVGTTIEAWHKPSAGSWTLIGSATDSDIDLGVPGLKIRNQQGRFVNFGGGEVIPASALRERTLTGVGL